MMTLDSVPTIGRTNKLIIRIRRLARSPGDRARQGLMIAEGTRLAEVALQAEETILHAIVSDGIERHPRGRQLLGRLAARDVDLHRVGDPLMSSLQDAGSHQGILLLIERRQPAAGDFIPSGDLAATWLVACGIQDPGNMGALVRVADAAGAAGLIAACGADPWGTKAVRASAGSIFRLPLLSFGSWAPLIRQVTTMREQGALLAGAVPRGGDDYTTGFPGRPVVLFVGGEGAGLPPKIMSLLEHQVTIPLAAGVESINVASAAAVLMFERRRPANRPS